LTIWSIEFKGHAKEDLLNALQKNTEKDKSSVLHVQERLVDKLNGLDVKIFSNEHPPPHFRVSYQGKSNDFTIKDCTPLRGQSLSQYFRVIRDWHTKHKNNLINQWNVRRPSDCPVGEYME